MQINHLDMIIFECAKVRKMNLEITDIIELKQILEDNVAVLVYFYSDSCQPCLMLRPNVDKPQPNDHQMTT